jgi:hypothetical protein
MKRFFSRSIMLASLLFAVAFVSKATPTSTFPGEHPYYIHALSDLRAARWMIEHRPGNWAQTNDEMEAVRRIDAAIKEIKMASIEDNKDINDHPAVDEHPERDGRLHEALDFLRKARQDISHDEDNQFARGLQTRAYDHIDGAISAVKKAIHQN